jgi:hypothetical protein
VVVKTHYQSSLLFVAEEEKAAALTGLTAFEEFGGGLSIVRIYTSGCKCQ